MGNFAGTDKIAAMGAGPRYRVYQDAATCSKCRDVGTWAVLDTVADVLIGDISYHHEEDAEWLADQLNDAAAAESRRIRRELLAAFRPFEIHSDAPIATAENFVDALDRICPKEDG
jgi:hypothetical protein